MAASTSFGDIGLSGSDGSVGALPRLGDLRGLSLLQLLVHLFLRLVNLGASGAHGGLVLAGFRGRARQTLLRGFAGSLGGLVPLVQDLFEWLEKDAFQVKLQQDDQDKCRRCFEQ